jgi:hypothetical protein
LFTATVMLGLPLQAQTFLEIFNNAPDFSNNWRLWQNYGGTQLTYTAGNLRLQASRSNPYPPGSVIMLASKLIFTGDVDFSIEFNHAGSGRVTIGLLSTAGEFPAAMHLDTDDTNYLAINVARGLATEWKYAGTPYMNRWITLRIKTVGNAVHFFADGVLLESSAFVSPRGPVQLLFTTSSVPWKSGDNDTSFRQVTAIGSSQETQNVVDDFSIAANPSGPWSFGYTPSLGGAFNLHLTAQPNFVPGADRWATPAIDPWLVVTKNKTISSITGSPATFYYPPDMLHMHPAWDGTFDVVRWTAPAAGTYTFFGKFAGLDWVTSVADTDVHILHNSATELLEPTVLRGVGTEKFFALSRSVASGDTIDFAVGKGPSGFIQNDSTGLKVTVAGPPGPVTTGTINVTTNLPAATFTITGPATYSGSGTSFTETGAPAGTYTVTFGSSSGYQTPGPQTQTLLPGSTLMFDGNYALLTGTISVAVQPNSATYALSGPAGYSGLGSSTHTSMPVGTYTIAYNAIPGYATPSSQILTLAAGATIQFSAIYQLAPGVGSIRVQVSPNSATYNVTGPASFSGAGSNTYSGLPVGSYTVTFLPLVGPGIITPASQTLLLQPELCTHR